MPIKNYFIPLVVIASALSLTACDSDKQPLNNELNTTTQTLSLNGTWKFTTFVGDGSNYRDITPSDTDVIIDNSDEELVEINGNWQTGKEGARGSRQWGDSHLYHWSKDNDPTHKVKYYLPQDLEAGYYESFIYYPFAFGLHNTFSVKHSAGTAKLDINQRSRDGQWLSLGIYHLDAKQQHYVSAQASSKSQVIMDAVMLRPVDEHTYFMAQQQKQSAPAVATDDTAWSDLKVPGHWGMLNQFSTYTGKGWYRKHFTLPNDWQVEQDQKLRLNFEGVYHFAKVYLNGQFIGEHQGGFTPFELDVTEVINATGNNVIAVEADNTPIVGATWNWGGIIRDVNLVKSQDARITYQYIHAEPDLDKGTAELTLKVRVENASAKARSFDFSGDIQLANSQTVLTQLRGKIDVGANSVQEVEFVGSLSQEQVKLWHFDTPHLYHLKSTLSENNKLVNDKQDRFGIRKIELTQSQLLLNGEPVRIGGYNRVSDHRYWGSSEPNELLEQDVDLMKNAGANFMRIMHGTQNKRLIELCDEKGILIFEEINVRELNNPEFVAPDYLINKQWAKEMVERDINHPSIIGWSVGNELTDHYQYAETMINYVKQQLDPYRLVNNVSNTGYYKNDTPQNDPLGLSDLMMQNIYQKDPEKVITTIAERWPNKPLFVSEYGLGRFDSASLDHDYDNFHSWHEMLRDRNTHVVGTSVWSFNDYRSAYAQTLEEENRSWGLVNNWRQKRRAYKTFELGLTPIFDFELTNIDVANKSALVSFKVREEDDYPSFTMTNYQLQWQLRDDNGEVLAQQQSALPTMTPNYGSHSEQITWSVPTKLQNKVHDLNIKVLSPNGYARYNHTHSFKVPATPKIKGVLSAEDSIRVVFDKSFSGDEYYVRYQENAEQPQTSDKTINSYIELTDLKANSEYTIELIAVNSTGNSAPSAAITARTKDALLPPVIWDSMIRDNKLIVGYSGKVEDKGYQLRYGYSEQKLDLVSNTSSRGMLTAELNANAPQVYFQLKRITDSGDSYWSLIRKAAVNN